MDVLVRKGSRGREDLQIPPEVQFFELADEEAAIEAVDAVAYEVIRHRLQRIDEEHASTIVRVSGSQVVTTAQDFNVVVADEIGQVVCVGTYVMWHGVILDMLIKEVIERRGGDGVGIRDGDMFLVNDPFLGAGHYNDVALLCPIFHDGKLISWSGSMLHQLDVGGNAFGSFCTQAKEPFDEPRPFPPTRIVEDWRIRADIEEVYLAHSRLPDHLALDLRAQVAGNTVATRRIREVIDEYGPETYAAVVKKMTAESRAKFAARLRQIPDGRWRHVEYIDKSGIGDTHVHKAVLTLEKKGEKLIFDTTGTDPQTGILNASHGGFRAGVMFPVLQYMCHDIPWASSGILSNIEFRSEPGTLVDAVPPGLVSCAGATGIFIAQNVAQSCIGKMLLSSEELREEAVAMSVGSWTMMMLSGTSQHGAPFLGFLMDPMAGAVGARPNKDGVDTGGFLHSPQSGVSGAEEYELQYPILYLYRREEADTGGAGRWRGGNGIGVGIMLHDAPEPVHHQTLASGVTFPNTLGLSGGLPGGPSAYRMVRGSSIREELAAGRIPVQPEALAGEQEDVDFKGMTMQDPDDVFFVRCSASGGYGDPLAREPEQVEADVLDGRVSAETAAEVYGVVVGDEAATAARREEMRAARRARSRLGEGSWAWHSA